MSRWVVVAATVVAFHAVALLEENAGASDSARMAQRALEILKSRPPVATVGGDVEITLLADKASWLQTVYRRGWVDASEADALLSDKLVAFNLVARQIGRERAERFLLRTLGLRELLLANAWLNSRGEIVADAETVESQLADIFPNGFQVRPAVGVAPRETTHGLFADRDAFLKELLRPGSTLYRPEQYKQGVQSHILGRVASGEVVVLQDDIALGRAVHRVRVHTYEDRVIEAAQPRLWVEKANSTDGDIRRAQELVNEFLKALGADTVRRQAWSVDVLLTDRDVKIADIITNRGQEISWSGYLDQPQIIAAYSQAFESRYDLHFTGFGGFLIHHGWANLYAYWKRRYFGG
jgi:hypothetical protein